VDLISWKAELEASLNNLGCSLFKVPHPTLTLLKIQGSPLIFNLLSHSNSIKISTVVEFQRQTIEANLQLINLWEDVWINSRKQVLYRIGSLLGLNKKVFGRKTSFRILCKEEASDFFNLYHLQGSAKAKYTMCLTYEDEVVAAASFSEPLNMTRKSPGYTSAELIRFACKGDITVIGGLTKLIKKFADQFKPSDIMSYADRDWSLGKGYDSTGFSIDRVTEPQEIWLNIKEMKRYFQHRLPIKISPDLKPEELESYLLESGYRKIFNTGNLKFKLFF
jgi:hypothetical protein